MYYISHEDFKAMCNGTVLIHVGPMLKDKLGKSYRGRSTISLRVYVIKLLYCLQLFAK